MIIYYSGTGNSAYLAQRLATILEDEACNIFDKLKAKKTQHFTAEKPYVFVAPTYSWRFPRIMTNYLSGCKFSGEKQAYGLLSCGSSSGAAYNYFKADLEAWGLQPRGFASIKMPENYSALFQLDSPAKNLATIQAALPQLAAFAEGVREQRDLTPQVPTMRDKLLSGLINQLFYTFILKDKKFLATDACVSCGQCVQNCPLNNIQMQGAKPQWQGHCTHCMSCLAKCPAKAIEYGQKSQGQERYLLENYLKDLT